MADCVQILTHEFLPFTGGIGVYVHETACALARTGVVTTVWAPDYGVRGGDNQPYRVNRVPMRGKQGWPCRWQMARALRAAFPDGRIPGTLILAEPGPIRLWMYQRMLGLPRPDRLVVILHGSEILGLSHLIHRRSLLRGLLGKAETIGVVSKAVAGLVGRAFPEVAPKTLLLHGAVRSAWQDLPAVPRCPETSPQEVIQVGRISPRKGQLALVEAVSQLPAEVLSGLQVRLIGPVGRDRYARTIRARITSLSLPVEMAGVLPDAALRAAYERAHILVQPSQPYRSSIEGLGLSLLEAAHFGCPVIGTSIGGIPEALQEGQTGWLVPPSDPEALSRALLKLLRNPPEAARMGLAGAAFVRATFSWDQNARILSGHRPASPDD